jgi:hypothetical protein
MGVRNFFYKMQKNVIFVHEGFWQEDLEGLPIVVFGQNDNGENGQNLAR